MFRPNIEACSPMSVDSDRSRDESMNISDCYSPSNDKQTVSNLQGYSTFSPIEKTLDLFDDLHLSGSNNMARNTACTMTPNRPTPVVSGNIRGSSSKNQENELGYLALDDYGTRNKFLRKRHTIACFSQPALNNNENDPHDQHLNGVYSSPLKEKSSFKISSPSLPALKLSPKSKSPQKSNRKNKSKGCCSGKVWLTSSVLLFALVLLAYIVMMPYMCQYTLGLDMSKVNQSLQSKVYGQPIAVDLVSGAIDKYLNGYHDKPMLVMSLHGWTGVGKNHITNIISSHFRTKTVKRFIIPLHYPHRNEESQYTEKVVMDTVNSLKPCAVNMIVFDEIDKAGPTLIEGISKAIQEVTGAVKEDMKLIILLLSNTGGRDINTHVYEKLISGGTREDIESDTLINILKNPEKYSNSWHVKLHQLNLIDVFVPLLPLGEKEVKKCIARDMELKGLKVTEVRVEQVNENIQYFPADMPLFSVTGCRAVPSKVDLVIM